MIGTSDEQMNLEEDSDNEVKAELIMKKVQEVLVDRKESKQPSRKMSLNSDKSKSGGEGASQHGTVRRKKTDKSNNSQARLVEGSP